MRIFLDSNVLLAAYLWKDGVCGKVLELVLEKYELATAETVIEECKKHFKEKFRLPQNLIDEFEAEIRGHQVVPASSRPSPVSIRDKDDEIILASAIDSVADFLITGDNDLLSVANEVLEIKVLSPRQFLEQFDDQQS